MSLLEDARTSGTARVKGPQCDVEVALANRPDLAAEIIAVIADTTITQVGAARTFHNYGIHLSGPTIGRHRRNDCYGCLVAGRSF